MPHADCLIIWITGASSGIGLALAKQFAEQNVVVILSARREAELESARQQLKNPNRHMVLPLDITDSAALAKATSKVIQEYGRIDYLINNAGISQRALIFETTEKTDRQLMEIGYFAPVNLTRCVLPFMERQGCGKVVFVSSVAGLLGTQYRASYSAAKAAIHMWANSLRAEYTDKGIKVSVIFPGFVKSNVSVAALTGDGTPLGSMDEAQANAMSCESFAQKAIQALKNDKEYIVIGGLKERLGVLLSRLSPTLLYRSIQRSKVR